MRIQYKTHLSVDECKNKIKNIKKYSFNSSKFRGHIIGNNFKIRVAFFGVNLFLPAFYGKMIQNDKFTYIKGKILFITPLTAIVFIMFLVISLIILMAFIYEKYYFRVLIIIIGMLIVIIGSYISVRNHPEKINLFIKKIFEIVE